MAQIKLLKIATDGLPEEMDTSADEVTLASFTVQGGGPVLNANLDMNNGSISDADGLSFTDPTTDGITTSSGVHAADKIMFEDEENSMDVGSSILFPVVADNVDQVDAFRLPALAGAPTAAPADGGEGYLIWDSTSDKLYSYDGSAWKDMSIVEEAKRTCNPYTAGEILAANEFVYISGSGEVSKADSSTNYQVIGVTGGAAASAASVNVCSEGVVAGFSGLTAGDRYFLDSTSGAITSTIPTGSGNRIVQVGFAKSATEMHLQIAFVGRRA